MCEVAVSQRGGHRARHGALVAATPHARPDGYIGTTRRRRSIDRQLQVADTPRYLTRRHLGAILTPATSPPPPTRRRTVSMLTPQLIELADGKRTTVALELAIPTRDLAMADPSYQHRTLADAAVHLAEEEGPNKAVAMLLGSALDCSTRGDDTSAAMAVGAAVVVLQDVARSQLLGVTP